MTKMKIGSIIKNGDILLAILLITAVVALIPAIFLLTAWIFMLLEGALGNMFGFRTFGFWQSTVIVGAIWFLSMVFGVRVRSLK